MKIEMSETTDKYLLSSRSMLQGSRICQEHDQQQDDDDEHCPNENDHDYESLEYEEDAYYSNSTTTPSFDDIDELCDDADEIFVHCWRDSNGEIDEIVVDDVNFTIEPELLKPEEVGKSGLRGFRKKRSVRVIFQDFSKPYLAKIINSQNYKKLLELVKGEDASLHPAGSLSPSADNAANELQGLTLEEQENQKAIWNAELAKIEEEINTLRHVLASKVRVSQELKRKLGISVWKELTDDVNQGLKNVKESQVYQNVGEKLGQFSKAITDNSLFQKTESVFKSTAEKTTSILGGFGSGISMKLGQMRNSDSFRSLEERVGSAYENVKTKVVPSRSNSTQSFDDALREAEATRRASAAPSATSPTIPEDKLLS
ncbi:serine/threonine-protein kinase pakF-like isoform X3 [Vespa mandarinia]|uniref:serine/threonine-protein kinase pakF-like isoform X3 n=1 Tax=Vespa mandarinia TaxID=7446 RepID=UPI00160701B1|nr:serine/threonine-protein kinase pakF-like isoform X3 [Vespa mandarinia]